KVKILTLPSLYVLSCLIHIKLNLQKYTMHIDIHSYNTRFNKNICLKKHKLTKSRTRTEYFAIKFMNVVPQAVQTLELNSFKTVIKKFQIKKAFYSVEEFLKDADVKSLSV